MTTHNAHNYAVATDRILVSHVTMEQAYYEACYHASIHRERVYVGEVGELLDTRFREPRPFADALAQPQEHEIKVFQYVHAAEAYLEITTPIPYSRRRAELFRADASTFRPSPVLTPLIQTDKQAREAAAEAAVASARTNLDALMALGVVVTEDTAMETSMAWDMAVKLAAATLRPPRAVDRDLRLRSAEDTILRRLASIVDANESAEEAQQEREAVYAAAPKGIDGRGRKCSHRRRGTWAFRWTNRTDRIDPVTGLYLSGTHRDYQCDVCGTVVQIRQIPPENPTPGARAAAALLLEHAAWAQSVGEERRAAWAKRAAVRAPEEDMGPGSPWKLKRAALHELDLEWVAERDALYAEGDAKLRAREERRRALPVTT